jgi:hypothetical protein
LLALRHCLRYATTYIISTSFSFPNLSAISGRSWLYSSRTANRLTPSTLTGKMSELVLYVVCYCNWRSWLIKLRLGRQIWHRDLKLAYETGAVECLVEDWTVHNCCMEEWRSFTRASGLAFGRRPPLAPVLQMCTSFRSHRIARSPF